MVDVYDVIEDRASTRDSVVYLVTSFIMTLPITYPALMTFHGIFYWESEMHQNWINLIQSLTLVMPSWIALSLLMMWVLAGACTLLFLLYVTMFFLGNTILPRLDWAVEKGREWYTRKFPKIRKN